MKMTKEQILDYEARMKRVNMHYKIKQQEELIRIERNNYQNAWRHAHKDKVRQYNQNYWRKKVEERQKNNANRITN